jgi:ABC-type phosphate transport system substrate-binding protein
MATSAANKLITTLMLIAGTLLAAPATHADVAVIVHATNEQPLDVSAVARIFLAQAKVYPGGTEAISIDQKEGNKVREEFQDKLFQQAPPEIKAFWARQKFSGVLRRLPTFDNDQAILEYIEKTPNAIGYIDAAKVTGKVRVLLKL